MLIFILLGLVPLGLFFFGLALFIDFRGIATHYTARNRAVVEQLAREATTRGPSWSSATTAGWAR
ncbi:hypothetical protein [Kitasatospora cineracea]|uniref:hypothetical protein n=1 Tax=Kitasatospora cineracea TaxID=88074 RepID=UPI0038046BD8